MTVTNKVTRDVIDITHILPNELNDGEAELEVDTKLNPDLWAMDFAKLKVVFKCPCVEEPDNKNGGAADDPHFKTWYVHLVASKTSLSH